MFFLKIDFFKLYFLYRVICAFLFKKQWRTRLDKELKNCFESGMPSVNGRSLQLTFKDNIRGIEVSKIKSILREL